MTMIESFRNKWENDRWCAPIVRDMIAVAKRTLKTDNLTDNSVWFKAWTCRMGANGGEMSYKEYKSLVNESIFTDSNWRLARLIKGGKVVRLTDDGRRELFEAYTDWTLPTKWHSLV